MSDIDFDELDKAVNNLVSKDEPDGDQNIVDSDASAKETTPNREQQPTQKPKGRFMDVVHHSSEMIGKSSTLDARSEKSDFMPRKVINPIYNDIKTPVQNETVASPPKTSQNNEPGIKNDWPDPIEINQPSATKQPDDTAQELENKAPSPLFLPDTKVEKRPLGGVSNERAQNETKTPETIPPEEKIADTPTDLSPAESAPSVNLPPELEADLVAIEEGASVVTEPRAIDSNESSVPKRDKKIPESESIAQEIQEQPALSKTHAQKAAETSGLLAAGSIPQQYKSASPQHEESKVSHPIFFDADHYDKTATPGVTTKTGKTSVFQWIFIVVGLLLLGATLGAALFVFVSTN